MAMYENLGFCPNNSFGPYLLQNKADCAEKYPKEFCELLDDQHATIMKMLGDRIGYMVYKPGGYAWGRKHASIVEVLCDFPSNSEIALRITQHLQTLIPTCEYAETGKKILIEDVISPEALGGDLCYFGYESFARWGFFQDGVAYADNPLVVKDGRALFSNDNFVVVIEDKEEYVDVKILKTTY